MNISVGCLAGHVKDECMNGENSKDMMKLSNKNTGDLISLRRYMATPHVEIYHKVLFPPFDKGSLVSI